MSIFSLFPGVNEYERVLTRQLLASARHWYRADTVTLSGANLATMRNRGTGGGALTVTAGTLAAPAPDAQLGGAPSVAFTGTQQMKSNLPASSFSYLHQDHNTFEVYAPVSGDSVFYATRDGSASATDVGTIYARFAGSNYHLVVDFSEATPNRYQAVMSAPDLGLGMLGETAFCHGLYPPGFASLDGVSYGDTTALAMSASAPALALTVGGGIGGVTPSNFRLAEFISFDRRLLPYERQLIQDYVRTRYGIALPTMTGVDREVLKLNPYSWIRADKYVANAGKVSAFPDLVLPLHAMGQGTVATQVAVPVADANFNGKLTAKFLGSNFYDSNFAEAAWGFLAKGPGNSTHIVARRLLDTNYHVILADGLGGVADTNLILTNDKQYNVQIGSGYIVVLGPNSTPAGVTTVYHTRLDAGGSPQLIARANGVQDTFSGTIPTGNPTSSLRLGSRQDGYGFAGEMAECLLFDRYPNAQELATIDAYHLQRYGVTP